MAMGVIGNNFFLDAVGIADVLTLHNNAVELVEARTIYTFYMTSIVVSF